MYVGAWQEYKLMKVIENLREENEQLRRGALEGGDNFASSASTREHNGAREGSRRLLSNLSSGAATESVTSSRTGRTAPRPRLTSASVKPKSHANSRTALRHRMTVRDVDVFVEEHATPKMAPQNGVSGVEGKHFQTPSRRRFSRHDDPQCVSSAQQSNTVGASPSTATVHTEMGTGRILRVSCARTRPPGGANGHGDLLPSVVHKSKVLENASFKDLLRGGLLDTKSKYQQAGQPLPRRQPIKLAKKDAELSAEEIQKRVERRLRLQMLYSGHSVSPETQSSSAEGLLDKRQCQDGLGNAQCPPRIHVPWDISSPVLCNLLMVDGPTAQEISAASPSTVGDKLNPPFSVPSSFKPPRRLSHPYDVGAPLAPPAGAVDAANAFLSLSRTEGEKGGGTMNSNPLGSRGTCGAVCNALSCTLNNNQSQDCGVRSSSFFLSDLPTASGSDSYRAVGARMTQIPPVEPLDEDAVGALLSWAEELDPESIM